MAFVHGKASKIAVAYNATTYADLSSYTKEVTLPRQIDMAETSVFGATYKTYIQGLADGGLSISGQYDSTVTTGPDAVLNGLIGAAQAYTVVYGPAGWVSFAAGSISGSAAQPVFHGNFWLASYEISSSVGDVVSFSAEFQLATAMTRATGAVTPSAT